MDSGYVALLQSSRKADENIYSCLYIKEEGEVSDEEVNIIKPQEKKNQLTKKEMSEIMKINKELEKQGWTPAKKENQNKNTLEEVKKRKKKSVNLWYNHKTWQYKLANDLYVFKEGGQSVLEKYGMLFIKTLFQEAKNNYKKNKAYSKMMNKLSLKEWDTIKELVREIKA